MLFQTKNYIKYIDSLKNNNYFGENPLLLFQLLLIYCTEHRAHIETYCEAWLVLRHLEPDLRLILILVLIDIDIVMSVSSTQNTIEADLPTRTNSTTRNALNSTKSNSRKLRNVVFIVVACCSCSCYCCSCCCLLFVDLKFCLEMYIV